MNLNCQYTTSITESFSGPYLCYVWDMQRGNSLVVACTFVLLVQYCKTVACIYTPFIIVSWCEK